MDSIIFVFLTILCFMLLILTVYILFRLIFYGFFKTKQEFKEREIFNYMDYLSNSSRSNNKTKEKNNGQK